MWIRWCKHRTKFNWDSRFLIQTKFISIQVSFEIHSILQNQKENSKCQKGNWKKVLVHRYSRSLIFLSRDKREILGKETILWNYGSNTFIIKVRDIHYYSINGISGTMKRAFIYEVKRKLSEIQVQLEGEWHTLWNT